MKRALALVLVGALMLSGCEKLPTHQERLDRRQQCERDGGFYVEKTSTGSVWYCGFSSRESTDD